MENEGNTQVAEPTITAPQKTEDAPVVPLTSIKVETTSNPAIDDAVSIKAEIQPITAQPVAAPIQQIAPLSANGDQTSSRESPKADVPDIAQNNTGEGFSSGDEPVPSAPPVPTDSEEEETRYGFGKPLQNIKGEETVDPLVQAKRFVSEIPGKFRIY